MMCYSIEPGDQMFLKRYGFLSFGKKWVKKISKKLSGKYIEKLHADHAASTTDAVKNTSKYFGLLHKQKKYGKKDFLSILNLNTFTMDVKLKLKIYQNQYT